MDEEAPCLDLATVRELEYVLLGPDELMNVFSRAAESLAVVQEYQNLTPSNPVKAVSSRREDI